MFGPLRACSLEQLLERASMRARLIRMGEGDELTNELDVLSIRTEIERRRDAGVPVS